MQVKHLDGDEVAGVGVVGPVDGAHPAAAEEVTLEVVDAETTAYQLARAHGSSLIARSTACSTVSASPSAQAASNAAGSNCVRSEARLLS